MKQIWRDENVCSVLRSREYCLYNPYRKNLKVLRTLICRGKTVFKKVFEKHSSRHISCDGSRVYFDNYRICYGGIGLSCVPRQLHTLPSGPKIEDALVSQTQPETMPLPHHGHQGSLLAITSRRLVRYDLKSGESLQEVFLSSSHNVRFIEISWSNEEEICIIRSTHSRVISAQRQAGMTSNVLMTLAAFEVFPLQFIGMMEVDKRIFGQDVMNAMISQGLLITMHQSGYVKMYSFPDIIKKFRMYCARLYENIPGTDDICGHVPAGLPINIQVTECPPVLFTVRCADHNVQIGGYPWHYVVTPYGNIGRFLVYSVDSEQLARGEQLDLMYGGIEPDRAIFHGDDSGRIIHVGSDVVRVLKFSSSADGTSALKLDFVIYLEKQAKQEDQVRKTSSGRHIKKRAIVDEIDECSPVTIHAVDYENELDVLHVSSVCHTVEANLVGTVGFYDNLTGKLLREIQLEEPWTEYYEHHVYLDLDTIVQVVKVSPGKFVCLMYRLFGSEEEEKSKKTADTRRRKSSQSRTGRRH